MNKKVKGYSSVLFMSHMFFMMIETKYVRSLGDYILEFVGLKSWTGNQTGTHLTIFYFFVLFLIGLILVRNYAVRDLKLKGITVFILFIALNTVFSVATGEIVKSIKANADGLLSVGLVQGQNNMVYDFKDGEYTQFLANLTLKNYSDEDQEFYLKIDEDFGHGLIELYDLDGKEKTIDLKGKQTRTFTLSLDYTVIKNKRIDDYDSASGSGIIERIILSNENGEKVRLDSKNFIGIALAE